MRLEGCFPVWRDAWISRRMGFSHSPVSRYDNLSKNSHCKLLSGWLLWYLLTHWLHWLGCCLWRRVPSLPKVFSLHLQASAEFKITFPSYLENKSLAQSVLFGDSHIVFICFAMPGSSVGHGSFEKIILILPCIKCCDTIYFTLYSIWWEDSTTC